MIPECPIAGIVPACDVPGIMPGCETIPSLELPLIASIQSIANVRTTTIAEEFITVRGQGGAYQSINPFSFLALEPLYDNEFVPPNWPSGLPPIPWRRIGSIGVCGLPPIDEFTAQEWFGRVRPIMRNGFTSQDGTVVRGCWQNSFRLGFVFSIENGETICTARKRIVAVIEPIQIGTPTGNPCRTPDVVLTGWCADCACTNIIERPASTVWPMSSNGWAYSGGSGACACGAQWCGHPTRRVVGNEADLIVTIRIPRVVSPLNADAVRTAILNDPHSVVVSMSVSSASFISTGRSDTTYDGETTSEDSFGYSSDRLQLSGSGTWSLDSATATGGSMSSARGFGCGLSYYTESLFSDLVFTMSLP